MIRKLKDENKKLSNELEALKDRLLRLLLSMITIEKEQLKKKKEFIQMHVQMY